MFSVEEFSEYLTVIKCYKFLFNIFKNNKDLNQDIKNYESAETVLSFFHHIQLNILHTYFHLKI